MTVTVTLIAHEEYLDDGTAVLYPGATLTAAPGYFILVNIGTSTTYTADLPYSGSSYDSITFGGILGGSPASGTFTDRNGSTCYYSGPYCSIPAGVAGTPATDLTDDGFADVEEIGFVEPTKDPETGEYPVTTPSGQLRALGQHHATASVGKRHLHRHHPGKHHWYGIVFQSVVYVTDTLHSIIEWVTVAGSSGALVEEGSHSTIATIYPSNNALSPINPTGDITNSGTASAPLLLGIGQHIVFNNSGSTLTGLTSNASPISIPNHCLAAVDGFDPTDPAYVEVYWVGMGSNALDSDSAALPIHHHNGNSHTVHGVHVANKSIHPAKLNSVQSGSNLAIDSKILSPDGNGAAHWKVLSALLGYTVVTGRITGQTLGSGSGSAYGISYSGFTSAPVIVCTPANVTTIGNYDYSFFVQSVTSTTASVFVANNGSQSISFDVNWIAIGS